MGTCVSNKKKSLSKYVENKISFKYKKLEVVNNYHFDSHYD
jgi:hypothetical protein